MLRKRFLAGLLALTMALTLLAGCGGSDEPASTGGDSTGGDSAGGDSAAAGGEEASGNSAVTGSVMIYTSMYEDIIEVVDQTLEEVFPECDIEFFYGGTGNLQSKIAAEMDTGKLSCDMMMVAEPYNPELKSKDEIPNSLYDFAFDTSVQGKISMGNPLTSGTTMAAVTALKDKYSYEYFDALGAQTVMVESGSVPLTKLETGECDVIMILE